MSLFNLPMGYRKRRMLQLSCAISLLLLAGCSNDDYSDLTKYIATVKAKPKGALEPLPERSPIESFVFSADSVRDPFKLVEQAKQNELLSAPIGNGIKPDMNRRREELEAFPLDSLKMVGTIVVKSNLWGLVRNADHTIYRVQVGNYMGKNYGKIIRIDADKIEIMEMIADKPGEWRERQASVMLVDEVKKSKKSGGKKK